jgi:CheY-like chemotaxis protein
MSDLELNAPFQIVLIEDDPQDVSITLNALRKANITNTMHPLETPDVAMEFLLRTGSFANQPALPSECLILLSLNLRGSPSLDLLRKLKGDERTKALPVIMLTSSQEERGVMQSYKLGANACIVKPVDLPKFIEAISELRLGWLLVAMDQSSPN